MKKILLLGISAIMALTLLSGCGDQSALIEDLEGEIEGLQVQNSALQSQLANMSVTEVTPESSLKEVEGSDVPMFETIDGKIKFPNKITVPDSSDDVNNSYVMVGSRFKFTPSSNWSLSMNGASLNVSHPSKIWGTIKAITVKESMLEEEMKQNLQSFFSGFPKTTITYRKMFMGDKVIGMLATADITVDSKPYVVSVGTMSRGEYGEILLFAYEDDESGVQQELIDLLIGSATIGDDKLTME